MTARRTHLFVSLTQATYGEMVLALRVASDLSSRGDDVHVLAPSALGHFFTGGTFRHIPVELAPTLDLGAVVKGAMSQTSYASVVLVDLTCILLTLDQLMIDVGFLTDLGRPTIALDLYNMAETDLAIDCGPTTMAVSPLAIAFEHRLLPAPFVRPDVPGAFCALPEIQPLGDERRRAVRGELGLSDAERLVLVGSSRYQYPDVQVMKAHQRAARIVPRLAFQALADLGPRVHVAHVGPAPWDGAGVLGARYHHMPAMPPPRFLDLLRSADLQLSFNTGAVTTMSAIAAGVPVVLGINSWGAKTAEELIGRLSPAPSPAWRALLDELVPVFPFRLWPQGYHRFLAPLAARNPFLEALETVEALDEAAFGEALRRLLFDPGRRRAAREAQEGYCRALRDLPRASDLVAGFLA